MFTIEILGEVPLTFSVTRFGFEQGIGGLYRLGLRIHTTLHDVGMPELVGREAFFPLTDVAPMDGIGGIVGEVQLLTTDVTGESIFELTVVPKLWLATRSINNRIFQDATVPQIVAEVLRGYDGVAPPIERLTEPHARRAYTTQYGESDWNFIRRVLADEGITSYFEHGRSPGWVLIDQTDLRSPARALPLPYRPPMAEGASMWNEPSIREARMTAHIDTSRARYRDYDFVHPAHTVEGTSETPGDTLYQRETNLEHYRYGQSEARTLDEANRRAALMRQSARSDSRRFDFTSNVPLPAGWRFTSSEHPRDELNAEMLVVGSTVSGDVERGINVQLECIRADQRYVPELRPRPRIMCPETARVVGEVPGVDIDVDSHARVMLKFHWDRRQLGHNTSRRVRVSQGWAGGNYGLVCLPRVNDEVIVEFLEGDPDTPIVVGRVHNSVNRLPLELPAQSMISIWRTLSTPGGNGYNQLLFDDSAGSERVEVRAQHDYRREVLNDSETTIGENRSMEVGGNTTSRVRGSHQERVGGDMTVNVGGHHTLEVRRDDETTVTGEQRLTVKKKRFVKVVEPDEERYLQSRTIIVGGENSTQVTGSDTGNAQAWSRHVRGLVCFESEDMIMLTIQEGPYLRLQKTPQKIAAEANEIYAEGKQTFHVKSPAVLVEARNSVEVTCRSGVTINGATVSIN
jgi:type VI secretion system secreted protein VgrG